MKFLSISLAVLTAAVVQAMSIPMPMSAADTTNKALAEAKRDIVPRGGVSWKWCRISGQGCHK
ncbi:uncharacterized protein BDW43DRAFT_291375 [Aspergillus alliaceus]|uniref:uncharacterized protein n=1 Tax=Petromyces alliaceus TaxID=209559 RepID=UPI0012A3E688|nr:uncharacterized protein BDW43DRAFT_291375 [Aspergillus alliaceus]KAB8228437.1 hypothetical protein BDW43DRAFT_291375 [Aspergillus alliaceus]